jgi:hypothetical protein
MISLSRMRERARVRVKSVHTTLTSNPLPPKEGEEVMGGDCAQHDCKKDFRIRFHSIQGFC